MLRDETLSSGKEWIPYKRAVSMLSVLIPPNVAIRQAERSRQNTSQRNTGGPAKARVRNTLVEDQVAIGQGTKIRMKMHSLNKYGFVQLVRKDGEISSVRLTEKGLNFDVETVELTSRSVSDKITTISYRLDIPVHMSEEMTTLGVADVIGEMNRKAIEDVLTRTFPGGITVSLLQERREEESIDEDDVEYQPGISFDFSKL